MNQGAAMNRRKNKIKELNSAEMRVKKDIPLFLYKPAAGKIVDGLKWCCEKRGLRIYDYCILPDRILLIADAAWGSVEETLLSFQQFSAKAVIQMLQFQRNSVLINTYISELSSADSLWKGDPVIKRLIKQEQHDELSREIVSRPVKKGWVTSPEHYLLSSEHPRHPLSGWIVEGFDPWS